MDLATIQMMDEDNILEQCLQDKDFLETFFKKYTDFLQRIDWNYFLIAVLDTQNTWDDITIKCIKSNLQALYKAVLKNKVKLDYSDLKQFHKLASNIKGKTYYKPLLTNFPEIKGYAFKLYRKNIIGF